MQEFLELRGALFTPVARGAHFQLGHAERRILTAGEARFIGGVFSAGSWALVLVMMLLGNGLRRSSLPRPWLGLIYAAVGIALIQASLVSWRYWRCGRG